MNNWLCHGLIKVDGMLSGVFTCHFALLGFLESFLNAQECGPGRKGL